MERQSNVNSNESLTLVLRILDQYVDAKIRLAENEKMNPSQAEKLLSYEVEHIEDTKKRLGEALGLCIDERALVEMGRVFQFPDS